MTAKNGNAIKIILYFLTYTRDINNIYVINVSVYTYNNKKILRLDTYTINWIYTKLNYKDVRKIAYMHAHTTGNPHPICYNKV